MKLNSINTYNQSMKAKSNPNFGMAKFINPETVLKYCNVVGREEAIKTIPILQETGCKNSLLSILPPCDAADCHKLALSFPRPLCKKECVTGLGWIGDGEKLKIQIRNAEKELVKRVIYDAAENGSLYKTKTELLEDVPELTEIIQRETNSPAIQEINEAAREAKQKWLEKIQRIAQQKKDYQKAHPILSKFYIPEFK